MKKLVILSMVVLGFSSQLASGQGLLVPPAEGFGDAPPAMTLPEQQEDVPPSEDLEDSIFSNEADIEPIPSGELRMPEALEPDHALLFTYPPALMEDTGTWLRRGFWFAEADFVLYGRNFNRKDFPLMEQLTINNQFIPFIDSQLAVNGSDAGTEIVPRFKLGRFLFRDQHNRDHTAEFIAFGGGEWSQDSQLAANPDNELGTSVLVVPLEIDNGFISFDGATSSRFDYDSRFNSFELNYHIKTRMLRDRMELEPSGHWVRRSQPTFSRSVLAGIRFFDLNEDFNWQAFGIDADTTSSSEAESGSYLVRTDNDMIGTQIGGSFVYETARWSIGTNSKAGMYLNHMDLKSEFEVTGGVTSGRTDLEEYNMGFVGESSLLGKIHLRPNLSLRASLEVLYVSGLVVAPEQVDFIRGGSPSMNSNGYSVFLGGGLGIEGYW